jgi:GT2 family glycosyltransferase
MVKTYQDYNNTGTIGIRLHYEDNTVQHGGVLCAVTQKNELRFGHYEFGNYYNYSKSVNRSVFGNTGAFMMISKKIFLKCEMFNENYTECFEDVELSIKTILNGCENIYLGNGVAYHYESQTRKKDTLKQQREYNDMVTLLYPMVKDNLVKLEKYILLIN